MAPWLLVIVWRYESLRVQAALISELPGDEVLEAGERGRRVLFVAESLMLRRAWTCGPMR